MGRHWSQTAGGCIRSTPEQSRRPPPSACGSRRCVEGRCRRCRPLDSCAPRAVRSTQLSTLRPRERAPANLAGAGAMESCAMTLRGCPSLGTRSPVQASVPGELSAAVPQRRVLMRPTLAWDQWQRPGCRRHHRGVVRSPWDTRTRWLFYYVKEVVFVHTPVQRLLGAVKKSTSVKKSTPYIWTSSWSGPQLRPRSNLASCAPSSPSASTIRMLG